MCVLCVRRDSETKGKIYWITFPCLYICKVKNFSKYIKINVSIVIVRRLRDQIKQLSIAVLRIVLENSGAVLPFQYVASIKWHFVKLLNI